jgi:hypothetical protein
MSEPLITREKCCLSSTCSCPYRSRSTKLTVQYRKRQSRLSTDQHASSGPVARRVRPRRVI